MTGPQTFVFVCAAGHVRERTFADASMVRLAPGILDCQEPGCAERIVELTIKDPPPEGGKP